MILFRAIGIEIESAERDQDKTKLFQFFMGFLSKCWKSLCLTLKRLQSSLSSHLKHCRIFRHIHAKSLKTVAVEISFQQM
jgi:hypothetical protein